MPEAYRNDSEYATRIMNYIVDHYADCTLESISQHLHFSTQYCSKLIKSTIGMSFSALLSEVRIQKAKNPLFSTPMKVDDIFGQTVMACGIAVAHFNNGTLGDVCVGDTLFCLFKVIGIVAGVLVQVKRFLCQVARDRNAHSLCNRCIAKCCNSRERGVVDGIGNCFSQLGVRT